MQFYQCSSEGYQCFYILDQYSNGLFLLLGKSTCILNILARANPPYEKVHIIYPGGGSATGEFDSLKPKSIITFHDRIPDISVFPTMKEKAVKTAVVIDDLELKELKADQRGFLDRICGHVSTHRHADVFVCSQQWVNIPPVVRRCSNVFVVWKPRDISTLPYMARGMEVDLESLFKLCKLPTDSVWVDKTVRSPAPLRLNGFDVIKQKKAKVESSSGEEADVSSSDGDSQ